jgi:two-component system, NarL family, nitrate/nitrite response regulator NarL
MKRVVLYSVQPVLTLGFEAVLATIDGFSMAGVASTAEGLVECILLERADLVLVELTPAMTLEVLSRVKVAAGSGAIILWVDSVSTEFVSQAVGMGVRGVLRKSLSIELQAKCLQKVSEGEFWIEKSLSDRLICSRRVSLSPRERQLVYLLAQGLKNKEIGYTLGITEGTVKVYLSRLFQKVGASDRFELALFALKNLFANQASVPDMVAEPPEPGHQTPPYLPSFVSMASIAGHH